MLGTVEVTVRPAPRPGGDQLRANDILAVLDSAGPWKQVLPRQTYSCHDPRVSPSLVHPTVRGRQVWLNRHGEDLETWCDAGRAYVSLIEPTPGHWATGPTTCGRAFAQLVHDGDIDKAAKDLTAAALGEDGATPAALALSDDVLSAIRDVHLAATTRAEADVGPAGELGPVLGLNPPAIGLAGRSVLGASLRVLTRADMDALPSRPELVTDLLPAEGLAALVGARGLGKTLLTLDLLGCVTHGIPWCGRPVQRSLALSLSLEGFSGIPERLRAWEQAHGLRLDDVQWVRDHVDLKQPSHAEALADVALGVGARVIVVDSARAAGAGAEDTSDMGHFVKGLERVQQLTGGLVLVLHNTGWNTGRERGSTLLGDACDAVLLLEGDGAGVRSLTHTKYRDGRPLERPGLQFVFRSVPGTQSGVLVEASSADLVKDRQALQDLLSLVRNRPGLSTGKYAELIGQSRETVSKKLNGAEETGVIENRGTQQKPEWHVV